MAQLLNRTRCEDRVDAGRAIPWKPHQLPALSVYTLFGTGGERVDEEHARTATVGGARELKRLVPLVIETAVRAEQGMDDELDALAVEIEDGIHRDETLGGTASEVILLETDAELAENGDQTIAMLRLTFGVTYYTAAASAADDQSLDSFQTADVRHDLGGQQPAADEAHDVVTLPGA